MNKFILSARPKQILKNCVVFVPLIFTLDQWVQNESSNVIINNILCFLAFSCSSIIGYQINDWVDKKYDKNHPIKKSRPIANNKINIKELYVFVSIVFAVGLVCASLVNFYVTILFIFYIIFGFLYTFKLKNIVLIDSISITIFYIIRMVAGAYSITLNISIWLYILTFFASLLLIFIKRTSETNKGTFRNKKIVVFYKGLSNLKIRIFLLFINILAYSIYVITEIVSNQRNFSFILTILFFSTGIVRYFLVTKENNKGESPELIVISDYMIQISVVMYLTTIFFSELY